MNKGTVLIIEDEAGFRRLYEDVLTGDGFNVVTAADGEKGWHLTNSAKPDLVLLDLILPGLNGFEVLRALRSQSETKGVPVLILSVLGEQKDIQQGLQLGADDYAVKGFYSPREILSKIRAILAKRNIRKNFTSYKLALKEGWADAPKLQIDTGLVKSFYCPGCGAELLLELISDYTRTDGHWFSSHFVCPKCERSF